MKQTLQRIAQPTAILVGLPDAMAESCTETLAEGGLRVLRAAHVAAAAERIPVTMPQLVLVSTTMRPDDMAHLNERCVAVGAEVLQLDPATSPRTMAALVRSAGRNALMKALGG